MSWLTGLRKGLKIIVVAQQLELAARIAALLLGLAEIEHRHIKERQKAINLALYLAAFSSPSKHLLGMRSFGRTYTSPTAKNPNGKIGQEACQKTNSRFWIRTLPSSGVVPNLKVK
jgi:hypothetical protein